MAAINKAGTYELLMLGLGSGAVFDRYFRWADQNLGNFTMCKVNPQIFSARINQTLAALIKLGMSQQDARSTFLSVWTNATRVPTNYTNVDWSNILIR